MEAIRVRAKFVVVSAERILHPGTLTIRQGRLVAVTEDAQAAADIDLGEAVLLPGLVNAHCHLEFSGLLRPLSAGEQFTDWIGEVVRYRRGVLANPTSTLPSPLNTVNLRRAISSGLQESCAGGVALIGDIVTPPWHNSFIPAAERWQPWPRSSLCWELAPAQLPADDVGQHLASATFPRVIPFAELLGLQSPRLTECWQWAQGLVDSDCALWTADTHQRPSSVARGESAPIIGYGLSPHAPYSIDLPTVAGMLAPLPRQTRLAMHVAESPAEMEWLATGGGPFAELYQRLGIQVEAQPPSIEQCLQLLARSDHSLLIHGNYLRREQIEQVAAAGITVVYCPRTHAYFGHAPYPLKQLLQASVRLALGTDSRASNPSLSLWNEVHFVRQLYPDVPSAALLNWVTREPATALGVQRDLGTLAVGTLAWVNVVPAKAAWTPQNLLDEMTLCTAEQLRLSPLVHLLAGA